MRRNSFNNGIYFLIWLTIVERDKIISPWTNMYKVLRGSHAWRQNHSKPTEQLVPLSHICSYFKSSDSTAYLMCQRPFQTAFDVQTRRDPMLFSEPDQRRLWLCGSLYCLSTSGRCCVLISTVSQESGQYPSQFFLLFHLSGAPEYLELNLWSTHVPEALRGQMSSTSWRTRTLQGLRHALVILGLCLDPYPVQILGFQTAVIRYKLLHGYIMLDRGFCSE